MESKDRHGNYSPWKDYRLFKTADNSQGIKLMREYLAENMGAYRPQEKPTEMFVQPELF